MNKQYTTGSDRSVFWIIGGITVIAIVAIGFVAFSESKSQAKITSYETTVTSRPKAVVASSFMDFGKMKVTDEKTTEFVIENKGDKPLQLFNGTSSCRCTTGQITVKDGKSPVFSMHSKSIWTGSVAPGEKAAVTLTYQPSLMPVKGEVTRAVYISTNDPDNKEITFTVKANVD